MVKWYYFDNRHVVPFDREHLGYLAERREEISAGTHSAEKAAAAYRRELQRVIPAFIDQRVQMGFPEDVHELEYEFPYRVGNVSVTLHLHRNLATPLKEWIQEDSPWHPHLSRIQQELHEKEGAVFTGIYFPQSAPDNSRLSFPSLSWPENYGDWNLPLQTVLNALCAQRIPTEEDLYQCDPLPDGQPIELYQPHEEVGINLRDLSLRQLAKADSPVCEFADWLVNNKSAINDARIFAHLAREAYFRGEESEAELMTGAVSNLVLTELDFTAHHYFDKMVELFQGPLVPPTNERWNYVVHR